MTVLCAISFVLCTLAAICWIFAEIAPQMSISTRWDDHQTTIDCSIQARGLCRQGFIDGHSNREWISDTGSANSLDPVRDLLGRHIGQSGRTMQYRGGALPDVPPLTTNSGLDRVALVGDANWEILRYSDLILTLALLPLAWLVWRVFRAYKNRLRTEHGAIKCGVCGYDMRATPDRCPECGKVRGK